MKADTKTVAVFFEQDGAMAYPFNKQEYFNSHRQLARQVEALGGRYVIVRDQDSYEGKGRFSRSWTFNGSRVVENGPVDADVIYDKGYFRPDMFRPVFNAPLVNEICTNKWLTYTLFAHFCPRTYLVKTTKQFRRTLERIPSYLKVVKPLDGLEGRGVHIEPAERLRRCPIEFPALLQEFIDSSPGIPGLVEGIHDFRITLLNGRIICAFLRTPKPGELIAAVSRSGVLKVVDEADIPPDFRDLALAVDAELETHGPRLISIDMAMTKDGPKLIELNSRVGLQENARHPVFADLKRELAGALMAA